MRTIGVVTMWYNEELLAPFFLGHYSWADVIHVIIDADTNDNTERQLSGYSNVATSMVKMPNGLDSGLHIDAINAAAVRLGTDWVIYADADEFISPVDLHSHLDTEPCAVVPVRLNTVFRHETEGELDPGLPAWGQRRYGIPPSAMFVKPTVCLASIRPQWAAGGHALDHPKNPRISSAPIPAAHWCMADVGLAIQRRINNQRDRMSQRNHANGWGSHNHHITEADIRSECERMKKCEVILCTG